MVPNGQSYPSQSNGDRPDSRSRPVQNPSSGSRALFVRSSALALSSGLWGSGERRLGPRDAGRLRKAARREVNGVPAPSRSKFVPAFGRRPIVRVPRRREAAKRVPSACQEGRATWRRCSGGAPDDGLAPPGEESRGSAACRDKVRGDPTEGSPRRAAEILGR